jgi:glutamyl-tRNA synthetase
MSVITRFAPSPTGFLHLGGARTALFSWLYAKQHQGTFIVRIEDTDVERSTLASVEQIFKGLEWLGITSDRPVTYQSQRLDRYQFYIDKLLDRGLAYRCYMSKEELDALREQQLAQGLKPRYDGRYREFTGEPPKNIQPVIRFKNPLQGMVQVKDLIRGDVYFSNEELDDFIIARSDGMPTYNFCVVIDDWEMGVTHVIRGDDHLNNTPRQINLYQALGAPVPQFAHLPMILGSDGSRLSKRHGAVNVLQYQEDGYLPQALLNYLVRLGWSHGDQEIFSVEEMIRYFDLQHVSHSPASFNPEKLLWLNQHYLKTLPIADLLPVVEAYFVHAGVDLGAGPALSDLLPVYREKVKTFRELVEATHYLFTEDYPLTEEAQAILDADPARFQRLVAALQALTNWQEASLKTFIKQLVKEEGCKMPEIAQPLRAAVTGSLHSPSVDAVLALLGRDKVLSRLQKFLSQR